MTADPDEAAPSSGHRRIAAERGAPSSGGEGPNRARRRLLAWGGAGAASAAMASCSAGPSGSGPALHTGERVRWTLVSSFPASLDAMFGSAQLFAQRLDEMSGGAFRVTPYQPGELVGALEVLDALQSGAAQVGHSASYYYKGKQEALAFDTCVPFGLAPRQQQAWLHEGGGRELLDELFAEFGVYAFPGGNTGVQMGGWFRDPIESVADLKGLRMRIPGFGGDVMEALGATVQVISGGEIYTALETARIDATEWVGPYDDEKLGFYKAVKNYYFPGWWEPGPELSFMIDRRSFDALPSTYQAMVRVAVREAAAHMQQVYDARNPAALARLVDAGVQVRPFSQDLMREARAATEDMLSTKAAADPAYAKILEPWRDFRAKSNAWFAGAELEYGKFAFPS